MLTKEEHKQRKEWLENLQEGDYVWIRNVWSGSAKEAGKWYFNNYRAIRADQVAEIQIRDHGDIPRRYIKTKLGMLFNWVGNGGTYDSIYPTFEMAKGQV